MLPHLLKTYSLPVLNSKVQKEVCIKKQLRYSPQTASTNRFETIWQLSTHVNKFLGFQAHIKEINLLAQ